MFRAVGRANCGSCWAGDERRRPLTICDRSPAAGAAERHSLPELVRPVVHLAPCQGSLTVVLKTMTPERYNKLPIVLVAAICTAGLLPLQASQEGPQRQDPAAERFSLRQEERIGDQGRDIRAGDTRFIFDDIFEFTDAANDLFLWGWLPTMSGDVADNAFIRRSGSG